MIGKKKALALVNVFAALLLLIIVIYMSLKYKEVDDNKCIEALGYCPHSDYYPIEAYVGVTLSLLIIVASLLQLFFDNEGKKQEAKPEKLLKMFKGEEKLILELLLKNEGIMLQSELVKETGFSRVKITRILDKLESKDIIERKRRGMTNAVVLKLNMKK